MTRTEAVAMYVLFALGGWRISWAIADILGTRTIVVGLVGIAAVLLYATESRLSPFHRS